MANFFTIVNDKITFPYSEPFGMAFTSDLFLSDIRKRRLGDVDLLKKNIASYDDEDFLYVANNANREERLKLQKDLHKNLIVLASIPIAQGGGLTSSQVTTIERLDSLLKKELALDNASTENEYAVLQTKIKNLNIEGLLTKKPRIFNEDLFDISIPESTRSKLQEALYIHLLVLESNNRPLTAYQTECLNNLKELSELNLQLTYAKETELKALQNKIIDLNNASLILMRCEMLKNGLAGDGDHIKDIYFSREETEDKTYDLTKGIPVVIDSYHRTKNKINEGGTIDSQYTKEYLEKLKKKMKQYHISAKSKPRHSFAPVIPVTLLTAFGERKLKCKINDKEYQTEESLGDDLLDQFGKQLIVKPLSGAADMGANLGMLYVIGFCSSFFPLLVLIHCIIMAIEYFTKTEIIDWDILFLPKFAFLVIRNTILFPIKYAVDICYMVSELILRSFATLGKVFNIQSTQEVVLGFNRPDEDAVIAPEEFIEESVQQNPDAIEATTTVVENIVDCNAVTHPPRVGLPTN